LGHIRDIFEDNNEVLLGLCGFEMIVKCTSTKKLANGTYSAR